MTRLEDRIAALPPEKRRLLELRLRKEGLTPKPGRAASRGRKVSRRSRPGPYPLTFGQQRLWFIDQLHSGNPAYNVPFAGRLEGAIHGGVLAQSLLEMTRRHEILRTRFVKVDGRPGQVVDPEPVLSLGVVDLSALPPERREAEAQRLIATQPRRLFDLTRLPLTRITLVRLGPRLHDLLVTMAHIVTDAWSMAIFFRELPGLYEAFRRGEPSPLPELPIQVADFAIWQREELAQEVLDAQLEFWMEELRGAPTVLDLPTDRPRPPVQTFKGRRHPLALTLPLTEKLTALAEGEEATLFMVLVAAFGLMLGRWSGQEDLLVASPVAVRTQPETFGLIGFFIDNAVLRVDLRGRPTFRQLLGRVRERTLAALSHQDLPFDKLVEALGVERDLSRPPLVQVNLVLQNVHIPQPDFRGIVLSRTQQVDIRCSRFDLTLGLYEEDEHGAPRGALEVNTDLFDDTTGIRMVRHLLQLLAEVARDPDLPVAHLPMLGEGERFQIVREWGDTERGAAGESFLELFAARVRERPEAPAVVFAPEAGAAAEISYARLARRAAGFARRLRQQGVGPETPVAVLLERSPEAVVSALAVLAAGGVWVPLDPAYPSGRLGFLLQDSGARVVIAPGTEAGPLLQTLPDPPRCLEPPGAELEGEGALEGPAAGPEQLAYLIYTSGSTGRPKGVMVTHRGLGNLARAQQRLLDAGPGARVLQFASLSFDASVWEMTMALASGAALHLAVRGALLPGPDLAGLLAERRITHATLPPTALASTPPAGLPELACLVSAGEACSGELVRSWGPGRRFLNAYGPTESAVCASAGEADGDGDGEQPPIGRPLDNVRLYVVDPRLKPMPVGVPGELLIGGAGVARGYLLRPALTAAAFVPDRFGGEPGGRLYRTGDRVRWLPDGRLDFLGRTDTQIKVRGHRVEAGEVEAVLVTHPAVREAAVDLVGGRLAAWIVAEAGREPEAGELRRYLLERLPEPMVPAFFVPLAAMPCTPSGKVDRRALPEPGQERPALGGDYVAPARAEEETLARIWQEVLGVERVGVEDNFFELGGDSILGIQMISRASEAGLHLEPIQLFEHPTVRSLAAVVGQGRRAVAGPLQASPQPPPEGGAYPLTPLQQGLLFHTLYAPGSGVYVEQAIATLEGELDPQALAGAWERVVERHPALRTSFHWHEVREPVQVVHPRAEVPWRQEDWRHLDGESREARFEALLEADSRRGFDLSRPPLLRWTLVRLGESTYRFLWSYHHLLLDGWSVFLVLAEVFLAYRALGAGTEPELPEVRPFTDYLAWLEGRDVAAEEAFWRRALEGFAQPTSLAVGRPAEATGGEPARRSDSSDRETFLPEPATRALEALVRRDQLTLSTWVHGAWALLLARYSGEADVVFGSVVSGRPPHLPGTEAMVGLFINTVPVRSRVSPRRGLGDWLRDLQRWQLEARRYEHSPLASVQRWSELEPGTSLFESLLAFESYPRDPSLWRQAGGLSVRELKTVERTNYPLNLSAVPGERLRLQLTWDRRRFDTVTAERLLGHLVNLLLGMAGSAEEPGETRTLAEIDLLSAAERQEILAAGRSPAPLRRSQASPWEGFFEWARRRPESPALIWEESGETIRLSYGELAGRVQRLAGRLRSAGVGPEAPVAVRLASSAERVTAFLAVLAAGGTYLPLDPSLPAKRLAWMLRDISVALGDPLLLVDPGWQAPGGEELPTGLQILTLQTELEPTGSAAGSVAREVPPESLAYVVYTSGSTGEPKGVGVSRHALSEQLAALEALLGLGPDDGFLSYQSAGFDAGLEEILCPLSRGARLVLRSGELWGPAELLDRIARWRVTAAGLPTAYWIELAAELERDRERPPLECLATVLTGGEAMPSEAALRWLRGAGGRVRLLNGYGPTEAVITATALEVPEEVPEGEPAVSIGRPLGGRSALVLDRHGELCPIGVPGELSLGGVLARGYPGRPALTAEWFVPDPFGQRPGGRLYRTGDRVRWLESGELGFLGRIDDQLKIRGYRVEPGEIEAVLAAHPRVREAAVTGQRNAQGPTRLMAYVVEESEPKGAGTDLAASLRSFLGERLPPHLIPSRFVVLPELPRTASGKVDRRGLAELEDRSSDAEAPRTAPREGMEAVLAQAWAEVLGVSRVAAQDNFFELGGDSILSIQLVARLAERGIPLTPRDVFEHPTPAELAEVARRVEARRADQGPVVGPVPLTPIQGWFFEQGLEQPHHWNMALLLELPEAVEPEVLETALGHLVSHHDALRLRFERDDGGWRQWTAEPGEGVAVTVLEETGTEEEALEATLDRLQGSLDLARGPLLRAVWIRRRQGPPHRLLLVAHHLVVDAVSWSILLEDLERAVHLLEQGREVLLPPKTHAFKSWAEALGQPWDPAELRRELEHWTSLGPDRPVEIPVDFAGGSNTEEEAAQVEISLAAERTGLLLREVQEAYGTRVEEVLLTALVEAFGRWTGTSSLWLHLEGHGRMGLGLDLDLSRTVGWFTAQYPMWLDVSEPEGRGAGPGGRLKAVKEQLRSLSHHGVGYGVLRYLGDAEVRAELAAQPSPQVSFNYLGRMDQMLARSGRFALIQGATGTLRSPRAQRTHVLEINAVVLDGRLRLFWGYSTGLHRRARVERLAADHLAALEGLIGHCLSGAGGYTPSDFPAADLDQESLDRFLAGLKGSHRGRNR